MRKTVSVCLIAAIFFGGCGISESSKLKEGFSQIKREVNQKNQEVLANPREIPKDLEVLHETINFTQKEVESMVLKRKGVISEGSKNLYEGITYDENRKISKKEACEDVDYMFRMMKDFYGLYEYLGGDTVFHSIREKIIEDIEKSDLERSYDLNKILHKHMDSIKDGHFTIAYNSDSRGNIEKLIFTFHNDKQFNKDNNGYFYIKDEKKYYVESINSEEEIEKYFRPTIDDEGNIKYIMVELREVKESAFNMIVNYKCDNDIKEEYETFQLYDGDYVKSKDMTNIMNKENLYEFDMKNGVPYVKILSMHQLKEDDTSQEQFVNSADIFKEHSVGIIDLSNNIGGSMRFGNKWIEKYLGEPMDVEGAHIDKNTLADSYLDVEIPEEVNHESSVRDRKYSPTVPERVKNNRILFVIVNKWTESAPEFFLEDLMNIDNVIIVGTNTKGAMMGVAIHSYKLVNSGIDLIFGKEMYMPIEGEDIELKGYEADIVVNPRKAVDRVLKLIEKEGLKK